MLFLKLIILVFAFIGFIVTLLVLYDQFDRWWIERKYNLKQDKVSTKRFKNEN